MSRDGGGHASSSGLGTMGLRRTALELGGKQHLCGNESLCYLLSTVDDFEETNVSRYPFLATSEWYIFSDATTSTVKGRLGFECFRMHGV